MTTAERTNRVDDLSAVLRVYAMKHGVSVEAITGQQRTARLVRMRGRFIEAATEDGYSTTEIGAALNRDHSTIVYHLRGQA